MIRNYFLVMLRGLQKSRGYALINIGGLSVGLACSMLILLWVADELAYDQFLPNHDKLYQVKANVFYNGTINTWGAAPFVAKDLLKNADAHIANTSVRDWDHDHLMAVGDKKITRRGFYATSEFLSMFRFPVLQGDLNSALTEPGSVVISESTARALFGDQDPLNQLVRVDDKLEQRVSAVLKDLPANSSFHFDLLLPWRLHENEPKYAENSASWHSYSYALYVELTDNKFLREVEDAIKVIPEQHRPDAEKGAKEGRAEFVLHALDDWHLRSEFSNGKIVGGSIEYVRLFTMIAVFVLLIACINFMNLATARSERRAKEVGIRKSVGSNQRALIFQFMTESVFISSIAFLLALMITLLVLPAYNTLVGKHLVIDFLSPSFWIFAAVSIFATGIISGSYPALYLSSFRPIQVLKGRVHVGKGVGTPRRILVGVQFGFSIFLVIGMFVIYKQVQHVKNRDMGFDRENLITLKSNDELLRNYAPIKQALLQSGVVKSVTRSSSAVTELNSWGYLNWPGMPADTKVLFSNIGAEYDYTGTMGMKILAGRDFSQDFPGDTSAIMINKAALDMMGLKDPIGQELSFLNGQKLKLVGVTANAIMGSPSDAVFPMFIQFSPKWSSVVTVRLEKTSDPGAALQKLAVILKELNPSYPFEYTFADLEFRKKFTEVSLIGNLANLFGVLAIFITGLGLFGLASFTASQRRKELGIRKVLGASVGNLVVMMSRDFSVLVLSAYIVAAPIGYWLMNRFLSRYAYRIDIPWWVFPLVAVLSLLFALLTVGSQALRAARVNPVTNLRVE